MPIHNIKRLKPVRKSLRNSLTSAGAILRKNLRHSQLDGEGHFNSVKAEYDARRTAFLSKLNVRVIRFENRMVFENLQALLETVRRISAERRKLGGKERLTTP